MRHLLLFSILITNIYVNAQWVQTNLGDAHYGYNLYSNETEIFTATLNGVYSTTDNGDVWFSRGLSNRLVFDIIKSNQYILAATEATGPGVYRTSDNGSTWIETNGMVNQSVRAFTKNSSYLFACTWGGGIFRSNDDGANWQMVGLTNVGFRSIYVAGEMIFAGADSIYFSNNNGGTWEARKLPYPASDTWCFYNDNGTLYAGDMGLYTSTDLGNTWQLKYGVTFDSTGYPIDVKMFRAIIKYNQFLIASIMANSIHISADNGANWQSFNEGLIGDWTFVDVIINGANIWGLTGGFGNAYKRPVTELVTDVREHENVVNDFVLYQNYPNPFNPVTSIQYAVGTLRQAQSDIRVTIKVYNVLGNEVATLVDDVKEAGIYEVEFDASKLTSGVFYYRLQSDSFIETRKMMFLK